MARIELRNLLEESARDLRLELCSFACSDTDIIFDSDVCEQTWEQRAVFGEINVFGFIALLEGLGRFVVDLFVSIDKLTKKDNMPGMNS